MTTAITTLPALASQLTNDHLQSLVIENSKLAMDMNFLALLRARNPEVPAAQFADFVYKAQLFGADPRRQQIYLVSYKSKQRKMVNGSWQDSWETQANAVFAYQFFIQVASQTGELEGHTVETVKGKYFNPFTSEEFDDLVCVATVFRKGRREISYTARMKEFVSMRPDKAGNIVPVGQWATKPYLMLEKCAIASAYRLAFPEWMTGMYINEEMSGEDSPVVIDVESTIEQAKPQPRKRIAKEETTALPPVEVQPEPQPAQPEPSTREVLSEILYPPAQPATHLSVVPPEPRGVAQTVIAQPEPKRAPLPPKRNVDQTPVSQASKSAMWKLVMVEVNAKRINPDVAIAKLTGIQGGLSEGFCLELTKAAMNGDFGFFIEKPVEPAAEIDDLPPF
jgi:phage recombination protein Bet